MSSSPSSSTPPHVLLVLTDQQSLWTISAYHRLLRDGGYASAADFGVGRAPAWAPLPTPHIDALAAGGALFANFVATSPMCVPSRASLFTGLYAVNHRATADGGLPGGTPTLGAAMAAGGYRTAYLGKWHLAPVGADERSGAKLATLPAPTPCSRRRSR